MIFNLHYILYLSVIVVTLGDFGVLGDHVCHKETNLVREKHGLHPYKFNGALADAARSHNDKMINTTCFSHRCTGESGLGDRVRHTGYAFGRVGENIAGGYQTCEAVLSGWLNSPLHRKILLGNYIHVGCVTRKCSDCPWGTYWTCVYGSHWYW